MKQDLFNAVAEVTKLSNYKLHAENLFIPVLNDLQVNNDDNPQVVLLASGQGFVEQFLSDGFVAEGEFEQRIDHVITDTKNFMKNHGCENVDGSFLFYKDYNNGVFNFKIYVQDLMITVDNVKKAIRQFNAFFVEPKMQDFYQLSLSTGPVDVPKQQLKIGAIDLENDMITRTLEAATMTIINNLKYKY